MDALDDVAVFVQVVNSGSFAGAADKLDMSKSVVSKFVTRLEDRLGARPLERSTRRLSLTEVGRAFFERSQRGLLEIEEAEAEVSRLQGTPRGELCINRPVCSATTARRTDGATAGAGRLAATGPARPQEPNRAVRTAYRLAGRG